MLSKLFKPRNHYFAVHTVSTSNEDSLDKSDQHKDDDQSDELLKARQYKQYLKKLDSDAAVKIDKADTLINDKALKKIKNYFLWKGHKEIGYFEPHTSSSGVAHLVFGTAPIKNNLMDRNAVIFLLELYAQLEQPDRFSVTDDFPMKTKTIDDTQINFYKVRKHGEQQTKPRTN